MAISIAKVAKVTYRVAGTVVLKNIISGIDKPGQDIMEAKKLVREGQRQIEARVEEISTGLANGSIQPDAAAMELEELQEQAKELTSAAIKVGALHAVHEGMVWGIAIKAGEYLF